MRSGRDQYMNTNPIHERGYTSAPFTAGGVRALTRKDRYLADPSLWIEDISEEFLWSKQREILTSIANNRRTCVQSCHTASKSYTCGWITAHWLENHPPGKAFVVTSAGRGTQVKTVLWREIGRVHAQNKLFGRVNQTEWWARMPAGNEEIVAFGRKPADMDPGAFQGIHADYVLVIFDEACEMASLLWNAADTLISNEGSKFLAVGNPDDPTSEFAKICKPGSGWNNIKISYLDTPNFTDEWVPDYLSKRLISPIWVDEKRELWGEDNPYFISKCLGEFPESTVDGLIPLRWIRAAQERDLTGTDEYKNGKRELGVDVGGTNDKNVVYGRRGPVYRMVRKDHESDTMKSLSRLIMDIRNFGAQRVKVDKTGIGWGLVDRANEMFTEGDLYFPSCLTGKSSPNQYYNPIEGIMVGGAPADKDKYLNLRAEIFWLVRELFEIGEMDIDPDDEDLAAQLVGIKWKPNSRGLIQVSPKRKIGGSRNIDEKNELAPIPSPDSADAMAYCAMRKVAARKSTGKRLWIA